MQKLKVLRQLLDGPKTERAVQEACGVPRATVYSVLVRELDNKVRRKEGWEAFEYELTEYGERWVKGQLIIQGMEDAEG